jgi:NADH-quinone oxidoreductase subunit G
VTPGEDHRAIADSLKSGELRAIWLGALSLRSPHFAELRALARALAATTGATFGELAEGGNAAGAYLAGVLPHRGAGGVVRERPGADARSMLERPLAGYLLLNCEPWADAAQPAALETLAHARSVVAITPYASAEMRRVAHVLLPSGTFAEGSGTYVSLEGRWQSQTGVARPLGASRPAWKILRVLGNLLQLTGFDYDSSEQVRDELRSRLAELDSYELPEPGESPQSAAASIEPVLDLGMYQVDPVLRRAPSLRRTADGRLVSTAYGAAS